MRAGDIIKHQNFMDVCCEVLEVQDKGSALDVHVAWINQGLARSWYVPAKSQTIQIEKDKLSEWEVTEPAQPCYRHAQWRKCE